MAENNGWMFFDIWKITAANWWIFLKKTIHECLLVNGKLHKTVDEYLLIFEKSVEQCSLVAENVGWMSSHSWKIAENKWWMPFNNSNSQETLNECVLVNKNLQKTVDQRLLAIPNRRAHWMNVFLVLKKS